VSANVAWSVLVSFVLVSFVALGCGCRCTVLLVLSGEKTLLILVFDKTLITFRMQHVWQIILLNGFEGGFSAIAYVGAHFIYGSW